MRSHPPSDTATSRRNRVLVIGGTCVDVLASYSLTSSPVLDNIGAVQFAVGGTAFNIASKMATRGFDVVLLTSVATDTVSYTLITPHLARMPFRSIVQDTRGLPAENVHVAYLNHGRVVSAITSLGIERALFPHDLLDREIRAAALVICDCNLRASHIREISRLCRRHRRRALAAAVSAAKVHRLPAAVGSRARPVFEAVVMNSAEAAALVNSPFGMTGALARLLCKRVSAWSVLMTRGEAGLLILSSDGAITTLSAPKVVNFASELGGGDAVLAALAAFMLTHSEIDWKKWHSSYLSEWLNETLATVSSTALGSLMLRASRKPPTH